MSGSGVAASTIFTSFMGNGAGQEKEIWDSDMSATILVREEGDKINIPLEVDNKFIFHHNV